MKCPSCGESLLVEIRLRVAERPLIMRSCSSCESRWWESEGQAVAVHSVLDLVAAP